MSSPQAEGDVPVRTRARNAARVGALIVSLVPLFCGMCLLMIGLARLTEVDRVSKDSALGVNPDITRAGEYKGSMKHFWIASGIHNLAVLIAAVPPLNERSQKMISEMLTGLDGTFTVTDGSGETVFSGELNPNGRAATVYFEGRYQEAIVLASAPPLDEGRYNVTLAIRSPAAGLRGGSLRIVATYPDAFWERLHAKEYVEAGLAASAAGLILAAGTWYIILRGWARARIGSGRGVGIT